MIKTTSQTLSKGMSYVRDNCVVINAPCSFGRVCEVDKNFCPRHVQQSKENGLLSFTSLPTGGQNKDCAFRFIICSQSVTPSKTSENGGFHGL